MSIEASNQPIPKAKPTKSKLNNKISVLDYASVRNLSNNAAQASTQQMLPGLGIRSRASFIRKPQQQQQEIIEEPRLLTTAKVLLQQREEEGKSQTQNSNFLGISSFLNSREVTPVNPLTGSKRRYPPSKNKMNSVGSELFDIQSNPEEQEKGPARFKSKDFRLFDIISGQSEVVYKHIFGKQRQINYKTILAWKDCLSHQDKTQIYLPLGEDMKVEIPYTCSRIYQLNEIEKGFKEIYGTGKNRSLTIGEESIIIHGIERYLRICSKDPLKIGRKDYDILENILSDCKMEDLQSFPMCMKQVETHFKLMATKWKYSGELNMNDRIVEAAIIMGKNNFLDLNRQNILTGYLLKNSNLNDI